MEQIVQKKDQALIGISRVVSGIFTPFIIPFIAILLLFLFSYLRIMPTQYKLFVLGIVYCFTVLMPVFVIYLYGKINGLTLLQLSEQKRRTIPYLLAITSYLFCALMMRKLNVPFYMIGIIFSSLLVMIILIATNYWWKFSAHLAGMGMLIGCIISFSSLFGYNPIWWLCLAILLTGFVGSARIILDQHKLSEVLAGFTIGLICSLLVLHPALHFFLRHLLFY